MVQDNYLQLVVVKTNIWLKAVKGLIILFESRKKNGQNPSLLAAERAWVVGLPEKNPGKSCKISWGDDHAISLAVMRSATSSYCKLCANTLKKGVQILVITWFYIVRARSSVKIWQTC